MSSFIKDFIDRKVINRRKFLLASAAGMTSLSAPALFGRSAVQAAASDVTVAWSYRDRASAYWNGLINGGEAFIQSLGRSPSDLVHLINEGSSEKSLADIKTFLARTGGNCAIACDANDSPNARPVVEAVAAANGYITTIWNKTDDVHPWDFGDNYVCHISWSGVGPSDQISRVLFDAIGGKGGVVHLGGIAANNPAIERLTGLRNALKDYPNIELLDSQPADWDTTKAAQLMSSYLTRFGDRITGVHCANDNMAYGALEALLAEGITNMPIVSYDGNLEAIEMVMDGRLLATVSTLPHWGGGITTSLAYHAAVGTFKPSEEPNEHREFYGPAVVITKEDASEFKAANVDQFPEYDWEDFWGQSQGQIQYE